MRRPPSLRSRLLLALMLMTLLTLAIASGLSAVMDLRLFRDHMLRDLKVLAAVVGESCVSALVFNSRESAEQRLATLAGEYQVRAAKLYDASGKPFAHWERPIGDSPSPAGDDIEIEHPLEFDGRPVGRLVLGARLTELERQARIYGWLAAGVTLVTLSIAWMIALNLRRRISWPITTLEGAMRQVSEQGDFSVRVPRFAAGREIDSLARGFNRMLGQIEQHEGSLREANAVLRRLATELSMLEEAEKARLADELHDGPMQKLALAQIQIDAASECSRAAPSDRAEAELQLVAGVQLMREAIGELRTLQFTLSPPILHQRGLAEALQWLAADTRERCGIDLTCSCAADLPALDHRQSSVLFRCARELVNNLIKHVGASSGSIKLATDGVAVALSVADDGKGFAPAESDPSGAGQGGGYGLYSIRERLALLGGSLEIHPSDTGSRLVARLPLSPGDKS
jgi:signal transduction histidine kinase